MLLELAANSVMTNIKRMVRDEILFLVNLVFESNSIDESEAKFSYRPQKPFFFVVGCGCLPLKSLETRKRGKQKIDS
jgi:hypothetical protein